MQDVIDAVIQAIEDRERMGRQIFNVVTEDVAIVDLMSFIAGEIGVKPPSTKIPRLPVIIATNILKAVPSRGIRYLALNLQSMANGMRISGDKLLNDGYQPRERWADALLDSCNSWKAANKDIT